jgi:hypothetical protein
VAILVRLVMNVILKFFVMEMVNVCLILHVFVTIIGEDQIVINVSILVSELLDVYFFFYLFIFTLIVLIVRLDDASIWYFVRVSEYVCLTLVVLSMIGSIFYTLMFSCGKSNTNLAASFFSPVVFQVTHKEREREGKL